ncbi:CotH kinase family protein [Paraglaciecola sp. MB-3u-78]|jgi:spore coat protein CotH|uniref:CotH kinase family protein n=1 Tax=Paraglaciecola sp. MB-3u-78 TaxID=2058332 RepID=UPI001E5884CF|nr:CotH kinase family protein [Paraglaciecola sp. MB-3u-78]
MREVITYDLLTELGVPEPQHAFVNLYINEELFGLYLMVEAVDGEFAEKHFANSNGDMYKPDGTGSDLVWIDDNAASYSDINLGF